MIHNDDLINELMDQIGLDLDEDKNIIIDQDTYEVIYYNGRALKFSPIGEIPVLFRDESMFDPIEDSKLMQILVSYYIRKLTRMGRQFEQFLPMREKRKFVVEVKDVTNNIRYRSLSYSKESLAYLDLLKRINGEVGVYLTYYDNLEF